MMNWFVERIAPHEDKGDYPRVTYEQGYTSGDMAGLAFGMVFGGLLVAGVVIRSPS